MNTPIDPLLLVLIFVFAVIALLGLGARSFTRLVELILSHGSKVEAQMQEVRQAQNTLLRAMEANSTSTSTKTSPITPDGADTSSTDNTTIPK